MMLCSDRSPRSGSPPVDMDLTVDRISNHNHISAEVFTLTTDVVLSFILRKQRGIRVF